MKSTILVSALLLLVPVLARGQVPEDLNFTSGLGELHEIRTMLPSYLRSVAYHMLEERQRRARQLGTIEDVSKVKENLRTRMLEGLGGFAERTPLNAHVVGILERDGYKIEKIVFESQPRFYVTANLYVPTTGRPPYPAILFPLGHERGAKANPTWQQMLGALAKKGFVALAWDPVGQGERLQFYDEDLEGSKVGNSTTEHTVVGIQCLLIGDHVARYTIWDGIRALDYLLSRKEVDPTRIGCTGNSGGGTHTAYLAALDDRIHVAAPSCYITSWSLLLQTIGPQDAEQTFPGWLKDGLDFPDFLYAFAPKPYLLLSAIRDFFPISGARESFTEAERVYSAIGAKDKLAKFEADDGHGYSKTRRMAAYRWFSRWLKSVEDNEPEPEIEFATAEELWCTPSGQVASSLGGETVFSLNKKRLEQLKGMRNVAPVDIRHKVLELSRFDHIQAPLDIKSYGTITRSKYHIEKLIYSSEPGIVDPALLYVPDSDDSKKPAVLYVDGEGKTGSLSDQEQLVKAGIIVLAIDARGFGETFPGTEIDSREFAHYFRDYQSAMTALIVGKTLVGMRAQDISRGVDVLASRQEVDRERIYGFGKDGGAVPMLYAAALDERIRKVALEGILVSYEAIATGRIHRQVFEDVVPSALKYYDFPDLAAAMTPREVWIVNAVNALGNRLNSREVKVRYECALEAFRLSRAENSMHIRERKENEGIPKVYREMLATR